PAGTPGDIAPAGEGLSGKAFFRHLSEFTSFNSGVYESPGLCSRRSVHLSNRRRGDLVPSLWEDCKRRNDARAYAPFTTIVRLEGLSRRGTVRATGASGFRRSGRREPFFQETISLPGFASGAARYQSRVLCNCLRQ